MGVEDIFNAARTAFTTYGSYLNTVANEIGMERALALHAKVFENQGAMAGKMFRDEAGAREFDAKAAMLWVNQVFGGIGISHEVLEGGPTAVRFRCGRCPLYEAFQSVGLDDGTIQNMCRRGALRYMDAGVKQLNPNLSYQLRKYRSAQDDFCEEEIVLKK